MTVTYLTGTRYPSSALKYFLPEYLEILLQRGESLLTTNKPGVDALIVRHCDQHNLPLQVYEFACDSGDDFRNRRVKAKSETVQVQRVVSPSWQRFRNLADRADKMIFFHAGKTRGTCYGMPTLTAFELACQKRGIDGEQLIVQRQQKAWVSETELRSSPTIGAAHIFVNSRFVPGLEGKRHAIGHFRIETWRRIGEIIQPGEGRREFVLPGVSSREQALLHMLHQALLELDTNRPQRITIHHWSKRLQAAAYAKKGDYPELRAQVRDLLDPYPQVIWQYENQTDILHRIGKPISQGQELWYHKRKIQAYRGLYQ
ncbi:MAG: hypothetical protein F9K27_15810 [Anaerolineae bacterium]|nr:MAG: hypothetical protein F9K27_15810 [Anaerolineae bacterium]